MIDLDKIDFHEYVEIKVETMNQIEEIIKMYNFYFGLPKEAGNTCCQAFYRGQANADWLIEPSINRININEKEQYEKNIKILKGKSLFDRLAYLQHYSPGTRLIDFTLDYRVALYFACKDYPNKDGALHIFSYDAHKADWIDTVIFSEIITMNYNVTIKVNDLSKHILYNYPKLNERFETVEELNLILMSFLDYGYMVLPSDESKTTNIRIQKQKGAFFICGLQFENELDVQCRFKSNAGNNVIKSHSVNVSDSFRKGRCLTKIIIDKNCKKDILKQLDEQGINENNLF